jgi:ketosteroid isomerase-like protein
MTEPQGNGEKIQRLWDMFESDGFGAASKLIEETFDPDVEFNPLQAGEAGGRTYRGQDGMLAFFGELAAAFADVQFEPVQCHSVGDDLVVAFTRMVGTAKETGMPLRQDLSVVYEFSEGLVRCVTAYDSPAEALEAAEKGHADA